MNNACRKREKMLSETVVQKRRRVGVSLNPNVKSVLAVDDYNSRIYHPKTADTEIKYANLLQIITKHYPDESDVCFFSFESPLGDPGRYCERNPLDSKKRGAKREAGALRSDSGQDE